MDHEPLLQCRAQGPVQPVLQIGLALPANGVRKKVAVEGGVLVQQGVQPEFPFRGDQLVQPDLAGWDPRPVAHREPVVGVGPTFANILEDHEGPSAAGCVSG